MKEFPRLSADPTTHAFDLAALRSVSRDRPNPAARAAARAALGVATAGAVTTVAGTAGAKVAVGASIKVSLLAKLAIVCALGGTVAGATMIVRSRMGATERSLVSVPLAPTQGAPTQAPSPSVAPAEPAVAAVRVESIRVEDLPPSTTGTLRGRTAGPAPLEPTPTPDRDLPAASERSAAVQSTLNEEVSLVEAARSRLVASDGAAALRALDRYDATFPSGALAPEAAALRVDAQIAVGDVAAARESARRYLSRFPAGAAAPRIRSMAKIDRRDQNDLTAP